MSIILQTLMTKQEVNKVIRDTLDKVLVLRFGRASDSICLHLDDIVSACVSKFSSEINTNTTTAREFSSPQEYNRCPRVLLRSLMYALVCVASKELAKSSRELSKFAVVALVDIDEEELNIYVKYFDIVHIPSTVFFFNANHLKMDSGTPDHTKWVGSFQCKQDFIDVVEAIFRGAMKGKLIVSCPLPPEKIPRFQLLFKEV